MHPYQHGNKAAAKAMTAATATRREGFFLYVSSRKRVSASA